MLHCLHLWGVDGRPSLVSPESLALFWYLGDELAGVPARQRSDWELVFSNNTSLSPTGVLPLLCLIEDDLEDGRRKVMRNICGYGDIVQYIINEVQCRNTGLLDLAAGVHYLKRELGLLTLYQMYLNRDNYVQFTRKQFSKLLYWPMWYNAPIQTRAKVKRQCEERLALEFLPLDEDDLEDTPSELQGAMEQPEQLTQSKTFRLKQSQNMRRKEELSAKKLELQFFHKLIEVLHHSQVLEDELHTDFEFAYTNLLQAYVYVLVNLPDGDSTRARIEREFGSEYLQGIEHAIDLKNNGAGLLKIREAQFQEQGNIIMSVYHKARQTAQYLSGEAW
ncbi:SAM complex subunit SAM37 KNAG_0M02600 [Huiozyma naganishii CBS 8797]|uniref:Mitochondrial outer membrane transport complex Sam37/metaxin N-terminal domain-containing protein n=1 Tax=Huiozyma naganishii (strain ATCC MYA-139 / BCRC 22969 / CBS 8797 / KCTC 17520 / NBRC 10181 / NCYC 3082 / Yp74L-3) TaxID=1071383 RepID=J7RT35_HUIN7|nr:hypothetical protein KNAG_0M02600 [Kazachstania naganishii CBS 8797]CCK73113.1 hypothetical protein KNAG_0M02600 [Kazachstania naganishii CBS 8797]